MKFYILVAAMLCVALPVSVVAQSGAGQKIVIIDTGDIWGQCKNSILPYRDIWGRGCKLNCVSA